MSGVGYALRVGVERWNPGAQVQVEPERILRVHLICPVSRALLSGQARGVHVAGAGPLVGSSRSGLQGRASRVGVGRAG